MVYRKSRMENERLRGVCFMNRKDLKEYKFNQLWIEGRLEYIESYKESISSIKSSLSAVRIENKKVQDGFAESLANLLDNINILLERIKIEQEKQKNILNQIEKVEQPYKIILEEVYIQGKTLVSVASELNYSYEDVCRKHGKALKIFDSFDKSQ